jgi:hypothetical protein
VQPKAKRKDTYLKNLKISLNTWLLLIAHWLISIGPERVGRAAAFRVCSRVLAPSCLLPSESVLTQDPLALDNVVGVLGTLKGWSPWVLGAGVELSVSATEPSLPLTFWPFPFPSAPFLEALLFFRAVNFFRAFFGMADCN